jgi:hypothetical protein
MATVTNFDLDTNSSGLDGTSSYTEGNSAIRLAPNAAVSASGNFNGQKLKISGLFSEDRIGFASGVTVSGSLLKIGGITIGAFSGGANGSDFVVSFNGNATASRVQTLIQNITFRDTSDHPTVHQTLTFNLAGTSRTDVVTVTPVNDAPVLDLNGRAPGKSVTRSYTENDALKVIAPSAAVSDVDSTDFSGGSLRISFTMNGTTSDQLAIKTDATVTVTRGSVYVDGAEIGTVTGGADGTDLVIQLTALAIPARVTTLLNHIGYANSSDDPSTSARTVSFTIDDGDGTANGGKATNVATATINVTRVNDAPVVDLNGVGITGTDTAISYVINSAPTKIAPDGFVSDVDSANFSGGSLRVRFTQNEHHSDQLRVVTDGVVTISGRSTVKVNGTAIGTIASNSNNGSDLVIKFNSSATPDRVTTLLNHIGYSNSSSHPSACARKVTFTLVDGDGGADTASAVATINMTTAVNHAPTDIVLSSSSIDEGNVAGASVATLSAVDPDSAPGFAAPFAFALVSGDGSDDNDKFSITGGTTLAIGEVADYESQSSYRVRLKVTDAGGLSFEKQVVIAVNDGAEGSAVDGYIAGATVFADANHNGALDPGEAAATTDAFGNFVLVGGTGPIVLIGGTDISTNIPFTGVMKAPEGSTVVTPLTNLVVAVGEATGHPELAEQEVLAALGLDAGINLVDFDPVAVTLSGDPNGAAAAAAAIQVQNTIVQASSLLTGAGATDIVDTAAAV